MQVYVYEWENGYTRLCVHMCVYICVCTYMCVYICVCVLVYVCTCVRVFGRRKYGGVLLTCPALENLRKKWIWRGLFSLKSNTWMNNYWKIIILLLINYSNNYINDIKL